MLLQGFPNGCLAHVEARCKFGLAQVLTGQEHPAQDVIAQIYRDR